VVPARPGDPAAFHGVIEGIVARVGRSPEAGRPVPAEGPSIRASGASLARLIIGAGRDEVYVPPMTTFLSNFLLPIALGCVALVLLMGLINMMRGGSPNRSQKLMRARVLLQFVAIVIAMAAIWAMGR
jgi:hypothetical protein